MKIFPTQFFPHLLPAHAAGCCVSILNHRRTDSPSASSHLRGEPMAFVPVVRGENKLEVKNSGEEAEIVLIGAIGKSWWDDSGITEQEVRDAIKSIPAGKRINVRINSEGGSVKEGLGIYNAFKERRADITCHITGYALSIAAIFPLGAGKVVSPKSAIWMMHKAWSWNQGNADDMRQAADMLDAHDETLVDILASETGKSKTEIRSAMEKETWVKGADAIAWGLADETDTEDAQAAYRPLAADFLSRCKNISPEILNAIRPPTGGRATNNSAVQEPGGQQTTTQENTMNKKVIVALLKKHGIEAAETETEDQLQAKLDKIPTQAAAAPANTPAAAPAATAPVAGVSAEEFRKEVRRRVRAEILRLGENKLPNDKIELWTDRALAAAKEEDIYAEITAMPIVVNDSATLGIGGRFEYGADNGVPGFEGKCLPEVENMFKGLPKTATGSAGKIQSAQARYEALKEEWPALMRKAQREDEIWVKRHGAMPVASNTYSATLVTNFLIMGAITTLSPKFAALKAFSRDNSVDPYKPLATGQMKFNQTAQDGSTTQTNATNFETGDSDVAARSITVSQYSESFNVSNSDLNSGLRMEDLTVAKMASLGSKVMQIATAPITAANFTATPLIIAPGAFGFSDMATLWGQLKKAGIKNLVLDGEYLARIINTPTFFQAVPVVPGAGWKNVSGWDNVALNTEWSGAGANVRGLACNPQAIGVITGLPLNPPEGIPGNSLQISTTTLPGVDVTIAVYVWFALASRKLWASYDLMLGATKLDGTAGVIIASGNPG